MPTCCGTPRAENSVSLPCRRQKLIEDVAVRTAPLTVHLFTNAFACNRWKRRCRRVFELIRMRFYHGSGQFVRTKMAYVHDVYNWPTEILVYWEIRSRSVSLQIRVLFVVCFIREYRMPNGRHPSASDDNRTFAQRAFVSRPAGCCYYVTYFLFCL